MDAATSGFPSASPSPTSGLRVSLYDTNYAAVDRVRSGKMPHREPGAPEVLTRTLANGNLTATADPAAVAASEHLVVVIGTPVDEHLNPDPQAVVSAIEAVADQLVDGQILILRSTVFPGVTRMVERIGRWAGEVDRRGLLPREDRRRPGHGGAPLASSDRGGPYRPGL